MGFSWVSGTQWDSVGLSRIQWGSVGLSRIPLVSLPSKFWLSYCLVELCYYFSVKQSKQALTEAGAKTGAALTAFSTATANKWTELK